MRKSVGEKNKINPQFETFLPLNSILCQLDVAKKQLANFHSFSSSSTRPANKSRANLSKTPDWDQELINLATLQSWPN